jgi:hypothetical protein
VKLISVEHRLGVVLVPRAASTTVFNAIKSSGKIWTQVRQWEDFYMLEDRVALIREPHKRLESTYRMYHKSGGSGFGHDISSFENFILSICSRHHGDLHAETQVSQCTVEGVFLPQRIIRWDFDELASTIGTKSVGHHHQTDHSIPTEWTDKALETFDRFYREDMELWNGQEI